MKNILIVKMSSIGDVIHALPVSYAIKETYPDAHLTWVVEPPAYDIVAMAACVDEIIVFEKKKFRSVKGFLQNFLPLRRKIQARDYDVVLDLQGLFKSAAVAALAKAPKGQKYGMWNMREGSQLISKPVIGPHCHDHVIERYLDTARAIGCEVKEVHLPIRVPEREQQLTRQIVAQAGANMANPYTVLVVGASWPTKCWPDGHFAMLGDWLYNHGVIPILVGSGPVETQKAAEIAAKMDIPPIDLVGKLNFKQLAYLFQRRRRHGPDASRCRHRREDRHAHGADVSAPHGALRADGEPARRRPRLPRVHEARLPARPRLHGRHQARAGRSKAKGPRASAQCRHHLKPSSLARRKFSCTRISSSSTRCTSATSCS